MSFLLLLPDTFLSDDWQSLDFLFALIIYAINSLLRPLGTWSKKRLIVCLVSFPSNPPLLLHNSKSSWRRRGNWHNKKCLLEAAVLRSLRVSDREKQLDYQKKKNSTGFCPLRARAQHENSVFLALTKPAKWFTADIICLDLGQITRLPFMKAMNIHASIWRSANREHSRHEHTCW